MVGIVFQVNPWDEYISLTTSIVLDIALIAAMN
jgi:hypothetical protein